MAAKTEWHKGEFLVSIDKSLFQLSAINEAFSSDFIYWASPVEESVLRKMLDNSLSFGVYEAAGSSNGQDQYITRHPAKSTY